MQAPKDGRQLRKRVKPSSDINSGPFIFSPFASLNAANKPNNVFGESNFIHNKMVFYSTRQCYLCYLLLIIFRILYTYIFFIDFQWIEGDVCEVVLQFDNVLTIPLQLSNIVSRPEARYPCYSCFRQIFSLHT